jgi:hypothetical protein
MNHADRIGYVNGVVVVLENLQTRPVEFVGRQLRRGRLQAAHHLVDVYAGLGNDEYRNGWPAVLVQHVGRVDHRHLHACDVAEQDRPPAAPFQHQVPQCLDVVLAAEAQRVLPPTHLVQAGRHVRVVAEFTGDTGEVDADVGGLERIERNTHFVLPATERADARHARDTLEPRYHGVLDEVLVALYRTRVVGPGGDRPPGDDLVEIVTADADDRLVGIHRIAGHLVQPVHDLDQRAVHVRADFELQVDAAGAVPGGRLHFQQARNAAQHVLLRFDDLRLDLVGRGGPPGCPDADFRTRDVGRHLDGQAHQAERAENSNQDAAHDDGHRVR